MQIKSLGLALAGLVASASVAAAVTFDFTTLPTATLVPPTNFTESGVTINVNATSQNTGTRVSQKDSPSYYRGLGVEDSLDKVGSVDVGQMLDITIPSGYAVTSFSLTARGTPPQAFDILLNNVVSMVGFVVEANTNTNDGRTDFSLPSNTASLFSVRANSGATGGVFLNSITLAATASVPVPATAILLGGALAAGGVARSRSKRRRS